MANSKMFVAFLIYVTVTSLFISAIMVAIARRNESSRSTDDVTMLRHANMASHLERRIFARSRHEWNGGTGSSVVVPSGRSTYSGRSGVLVQRRELPSTKRQKRSDEAVPSNVGGEDPCLSQPCMHGGVCSVLEGKARCACANGFSGDVCQHNINECWSNPCLNGAICIDGVNRYNCDCKDGWAGETCGEDIDECASSPCYNGGRCTTPQIAMYQCYCIRGFYGFHCEKDIEECKSYPCQNGGNCIDVTNMFICKCQKGFIGKFCEIEINECASNPCKNGATCLDEISRFTCECDKGYSGTFCNESINECEDDPCENDGACIEEASGFTCDCSLGFDGKFCEDDIDECASMPCRNGGVCYQPEPGSYKCSCAIGYTGRICETNINECQPNPCKNKGICRDDIGRAACTCPSGFAGEFCQVDLDECTSDPCQHGGICIDMEGEFECMCEDGYAGSFCQININECASYPCRNGGQCLDQVDSFSCICARGYVGKTCEVNVDECTSQPCKNGASCLDQIDSFTCKCAPGYEGDTCELPANECVSSPCMNGGTCQDGVNSFACSCSPGYGGERCERDVNECSSLPCNNGGRCMDLVNGYVCECAPGFTDSNCQVDVDECASNPCLNGGTCENGRNSYRCRCTSSYDGPNCDAEVSICTATSCLNGGTCVEEEDSFSCECVDGYEGNHCHIESDECKSAPCENGALCIDGVNEFRCVCREGHRGKTCNDTSLAEAQAQKDMFFSFIPTGGLLVLSIIVVITLASCLKSKTPKIGPGQVLTLENASNIDGETAKKAGQDPNAKDNSKSLKQNGTIKSTGQASPVQNGKSTHRKSKRKHHGDKRSHISSTHTLVKSEVISDKLALQKDEDGRVHKEKRREGRHHKDHHHGKKRHHHHKDKNAENNPEAIELQERIAEAEENAKKISQKIDELNKVGETGDSVAAENNEDAPDSPSKKDAEAQNLPPEKEAEEVHGIKEKEIISEGQLNLTTQQHQAADGNVSFSHTRLLDAPKDKILGNNANQASDPTQKKNTGSHTPLNKAPGANIPIDQRHDKGEMQGEILENPRIKADDGKEHNNHMEKRNARQGQKRFKQPQFPQENETVNDIPPVHGQVAPHNNNIMNPANRQRDGQYKPANFDPRTVKFNREQHPGNQHENMYAPDQYDQAFRDYILNNGMPSQWQRGPPLEPTAPAMPPYWCQEAGYPLDAGQYLRYPDGKPLQGHPRSHYKDEAYPSNQMQGYVDQRTSPSTLRKNEYASPRFQRRSSPPTNHQIGPTPRGWRQTGELRPKYPLGDKIDSDGGNMAESLRAGPRSRVDAYHHGNIENGQKDRPGRRDDNSTSPEKYNPSPNIYKNRHHHESHYRPEPEDPNYASTRNASPALIPNIPHNSPCENEYFTGNEARRTPPSDPRDNRASRPHYSTSPGPDVAKANLRSPWEPVWDEETVKKMNPRTPEASNKLPLFMKSLEGKSQWQDFLNGNLAKKRDAGDLDKSVSDENLKNAQLSEEKTFDVPMSNSYADRMQSRLQPVQEGTIYQNFPRPGVGPNAASSDTPPPIPPRRKHDIASKPPDAKPSVHTPNRTFLNDYGAVSPRRPHQIGSQDIRDQPAPTTPMQPLSYSRYFSPGTLHPSKVFQSTDGPGGVGTAYDTLHRPEVRTPRETRDSGDCIVPGSNLQRPRVGRECELRNADRSQFPSPPSYDATIHETSSPRARKSDEVDRRPGKFRIQQYQRRPFPNEFGLRNPMGMNRENAFVKRDHMLV